MSLNRSSAVTRALAGGVGDVVRAPALVLVAVAATLAAAAPFALAVGVQLQQSLAHRQPAILPPADAAEIDFNWWREFSERAQGTAATVTPSIIGFAAPLDNVSAILDGTTRPLALAAPIAIALMAWAFIWGAALARFAGRPTPVGMWRSGLRTLWPYTAISMAAAASVLLLYSTVHPLLFNVLGARVQTAFIDERAAFAWRVFLYLMFGLLLAVISTVADYARVCLALSPNLTTQRALADSWRFVRRHAAEVLKLYLATGLLFVLLLTGYGAVDIIGGVSVGGWRGVIAAQAYIIARIAIRLAVAASELRLFRALTEGRDGTGVAHDASAGR